MQQHGDDADRADEGEAAGHSRYCDIERGAHDAMSWNADRRQQAAGAGFGAGGFRR